MIRSFEAQDADHVWQQVVQAFRASEGVLEQPSRGGPTREILHAVMSINDPRQRWVASRRPPLNVAFAIAEVVWMMTGRNDLSFLETWNSRLPNYVGEGPQLHGAYGHRLRHHMGIDQLTRAYQALSNNPNTRQIVLQIWNAAADLPYPDGSPADQDIPCNVSSLLKIREGKLEWLQVIRSNDLFLGVPYNFIQFTCLQEIMAGWLGVECGTYHQLSDSLHMYQEDEKKAFDSLPMPNLLPNTDSLALPKGESEATFAELGRRMERLTMPDLRRNQVKALAVWDEGPEAFRNMLSILASEAARRHRWPTIHADVMVECTNPLYRELWHRWLTHVNT